MVIFNIMLIYQRVIQIPAVILLILESAGGEFVSMAADQRMTQKILVEVCSSHRWTKGYGGYGCCRSTNRLAFPIKKIRKVDYWVLAGWTEFCQAVVLFVGLSVCLLALTKDGIHMEDLKFLPVPKYFCVLHVKPAPFANLIWCNLFHSLVFPPFCWLNSPFVGCSSSHAC